MKAALTTLSAAVFSAALALAGTEARPVVYNNAQGDGDAGLDRAIKEAYSARFTIVDIRSSDGFAEASATEGSLPTAAAAETGEPLAGYVLAAYIVGADGLVADPVILKATDARLGPVAIEAMSHWRFSPGRLNGQAVATTAAQEFTFGAADAGAGLQTDRIAVYQNQDVLLRRLPGPDVFGAYVKRLGLVAHRFFVGDTAPERLDVVVALRPGAAPRAWLVSSTRAGDSRELEPLRALLLAVPPVEVREGPVAFALSARIAGGGGPPLSRDSPPPIPREWREAAGSMKEPASFSSDEFLNAVCRADK